MTKLILLFTIIPLIELWALIRLSHVLGSGLTILLIACTGTIGAILTKRQSTSVLKKINDSLAQGQIPADKLIDGLLILIGGVMLITPGILTDLAGFSCVLPVIRPKVKYLCKGKLEKLVETGRIQFFGSNTQENVNKDNTDNQQNQSN
jgi:UPF0716 protein FxsA